MKRKFYFLPVLVILLLYSYLSEAQAPQKFSYQAVIRNTDNELLTNAIIRTRISILQGSANGTAVYVESHTPTTNDNGLVTLQIGSGTVAEGSFSDIDWSAGPYFIRTETDPTGGIDYTISGTNQLLSVPYAMYAENAGNAPPGPQGPEGPEGPEGKSTYQVWLDEGNTGSESDFFISLIGAIGPEGKSAYDLWLELGNTGAVEDFLSSLIGPMGLDGVDGKSAYDIWLEEDNTGSMEDFLLSLRGSAGTNGLTAHELWLLDGNSGAYGDFLLSLIGPAGPDGKSAYQTWLEAGNSGTELDFINSLAGAQGIEGKSAYQVWLDLGNTGTEADFLTSLQGPAGPVGGYPQHFIGESYGGGIVFYVYDDGQHGLIVSSTDLSSGSGWSADNLSTRAKGDGLGAGNLNTSIIISAENTLNADDFAAALCNEYTVIDNGVTYGDWYLPSMHELNLLYLVKGTVGIPDQSYWSSTEFNNVQAWKQIFSDGTQTSVSKNAMNNVRAIRAF